MGSPLRILLLSQDAGQGKTLSRLLEREGVPSDTQLVTALTDYEARLAKGGFDAVLCMDSAAKPGEFAALDLALKSKIPFLLVADEVDAGFVGRLRSVPGADYILKSQLWNLAPTVRRISARGAAGGREGGMERLVTAIQELSLARDLASVMAVVRRAAREITGAAGATFVLRDGDKCYYADEDAIAPLWKGCRFPMETCISGWAMLNRQAAVIEDIYADPRVPADAYRPTFVKSLVMVPIRTIAPIGAIGNYWAERRLATAEEVRLLQALADSASVAMENVELYRDLENRVRDRTAELETANRDLEAFSYTVSHDLRAPLRSVDGFAAALEEECAGQLDDTGRKHLSRVRFSAKLMSEMIDDILSLSRVSRQEVKDEEVSLTEVACGVLEDLRRAEPARKVETVVADGLTAWGDRGLLRVALQNLLENAWKYTSKTPAARIEFGRAPATPGSDGGGKQEIFFVRDNGAGFDMAYAGKLFNPFQRLHSKQEFEGSGVGLATVDRVIRRHGGRVWPEAAVGKGAVFYFTLAPRPSPDGN
jgi:signal transduction histidine kinase